MRTKKKKPAFVILGSNATFATCELCGAKNEELRPYGPKGEKICFDCGMKNKNETDKKITDFLNGKQ